MGAGVAPSRGLQTPTSLDLTICEQQHLYYWGRPGERNVVQFHAFFFVTVVKINDVTAIGKSSLSHGGKNVEPAKTFPQKKTCPLKFTTAEVEQSCSSSEGKKLLKYI